jgi:hypothetical protein
MAGDGSVALGRATGLFRRFESNEDGRAQFGFCQDY